MVQSLVSQPYERLSKLDGHSVVVYYSHGHAARAHAITARVDKAMAWYQQLLEFHPEVTLLVLTEADWGHFTKFPVYGMPHYNDDRTLIVAAEDNAFWKSFLPPLEQLPEDLRDQVKTTYRLPDGNLGMEAFFDLLALHELGHAFHFQAGLNMQRKWMGELYVNILLHSFIAENEKSSLPALTLFPRMVISSGAKKFPFTSLKDVHERYNEIGQKYPNNYGWYQSRWHFAASRIYDSAGREIGRKLWDALKEKKEVLGDDQLPGFLEKAGAAPVADLIRNWDKDIVW